MAVPPDIYENGVDFTSLALQYPEFSKKLKPNRQLDFSDPESVRQLTKALLHRDFNLTIDLPQDRLCPPVPNRFNYVLFIQRLLDSTSPTFRESHDPNRHVLGLDIGTGASCIYPLLGTRQNPRWSFLCTEIDSVSLASAHQNILANDLQNRIKLFPTESTLIPSSSLAQFPKIDFLMTNPPFYASKSDLLASAESKHRPPNSSCTGAPVEMIYPSGGEVGFLSTLIRESLLPTNRKKIQWFTSMLGKLSSVGAVVDELKRSGCANWVVWEMVNAKGSGKGRMTTRRWGIGWSWMGFRPGMEVARGVGAGGGVERKFLPYGTEVDWVVEGGKEMVGRMVDGEAGRLDLHWRWKESWNQGVGFSWEGDVWSRKARRRKDQGTNAQIGRQEDGDGDEDGEDEEEEDKEPALVFKITLGDSSSSNNPISRHKAIQGDEMDVDKPEPEQKHQAGGVSVHVRWLQGQDPILFESFCGWLKWKTQARTETQT